MKYEIRGPHVMSPLEAVRPIVLPTGLEPPPLSPPPDQLTGKCDKAIEPNTAGTPTQRTVAGMRGSALDN